MVAYSNAEKRFCWYIAGKTIGKPRDKEWSISPGTLPWPRVAIQKRLERECHLVVRRAKGPTCRRFPKQSPWIHVIRCGLQGHVQLRTLLSNCSCFRKSLGPRGTQPCAGTRRCTPQQKILDTHFPKPVYYLIYRCTPQHKIYEHFWKGLWERWWFPTLGSRLHTQKLVPC